MCDVSSDNHRFATSDGRCCDERVEFSGRHAQSPMLGTQLGKNNRRSVVEFEDRHAGKERFDLESVPRGIARKLDSHVELAR